jgi:hypothetical protein
MDQSYINILILNLILLDPSIAKKNNLIEKKKSKNLNLSDIFESNQKKKIFRKFKFKYFLCNYICI